MASRSPPARNRSAARFAFAAACGKRRAGRPSLLQKFNRRDNHAEDARHVALSLDGEADEMGCQYGRHHRHLRDQAALAMGGKNWRIFQLVDKLLVHHLNDALYKI